MGYLEDRQRRIAVFEDTIQYCEQEQKLVNAIRNSRENTRLYLDPLSDTEKPEADNRACRITVSAMRTIECACKLAKEYPDSRIGVLNFASATNPGGGVIRGSNAQEECLCRCSTLYPCLDVDPLWQGYYTFHRKRHSALYTDACIYTPDIVAFKSDEKWPMQLSQEDWITLDIISCAAPNLRECPSNDMNPSAGERVLIKDKDLRELLEQRIRGILQVAAFHEVDVLVLGAFGCGAFRNSPQMVAEVFKKALEEYQCYFNAVEFAVYCNLSDMSNYEVFASVLQSQYS